MTSETTPRKIDGRSKHAALEMAVQRVLNEPGPDGEKNLVRIVRALVAKAAEGDRASAQEIFDRWAGKVAQRYEGKTEHQLTAGGAFAKLLEQMNRKQPGDDAKLIEQD